MSKLILLFATLALSAGFAASHKISITSPLSYGSKTLKAGEYKVEVQGDKAVFTSGKEVVELPVVVEEAAEKYRDTQLGTSGGANGAQLQEIKLGGTKTKLIFKPAAGATANAGGQATDPAQTPGIGTAVGRASERP